MLPWWKKEGTNEKRLVSQIQELSAEHSDSSHLKLYKEEFAILFVHTSNHGEQTLPETFSIGDTFRVLQHTFSDPVELSAPCTTAWYEEGGRSNSEAAAQLLQHMRALKYLCYETLDQE